jgi:hypothetical protein
MAKLVSVASNPDSQPTIVAPKRGPGRPRVSNPDLPKGMGLVDMVRVACLRQYRIATIIGAIVGGSVPFAVYWLSHYYVDHGLWSWSMVSADSGVNRSVVAALLTLGGLVYSVSTVAEIIGLAVQSKSKGIGFTILMEGIMVAAPDDLRWLAAYALVLLVVINAVSTGTKLARTSTLRAPTPEATP